MTDTLKERRQYQQIILSRSRNPRYFGENPYCQDAVEITILMAETVKGKTKEETLKIVEQFHQVILDRAELPPTLSHLRVIEGVKHYPIKAKCTTLAWHTLKAVIFDACF